MRNVFLIVALVTLAFCSAGCGRPGAPEPVSAEPTATRTVSLGLIPEQNIFRQVDRYEPIAEHLSRKLGVRVELKILRHYGNIVDNFRDMKMDGAFLGSFSYVLAHKELGVEVLARPLGEDGTSKYHGYLVVRKDSGIRGARDMRGKVFAFVNKATTAGYLFPLVYLQSNGITNYSKYFSEVYFAGTHEDVISDVLNHRADVGAVKNTVYARLAQTDRRIEEELVILDRSPDVPENALAVRRDMDAALKAALKEALLTMHQSSEGRAVLTGFGARRFIDTTDADYEPVVRYARQIGVDIELRGHRSE